MTIVEIGLVLEGHELALAGKVDLAYFTAWHAGLFSQPYAKGKFPEFSKFHPNKNARPKAASQEQIEQSFIAFVHAAGGTHH